MKQTFIISAALLLSLTAAAKERPAEERLQIARQTAASLGLTAEPEMQSLPASVDGKSNISARKGYYVYNIGEKGFVIVSGDDSQPPVLGYSDKGAFPQGEQMPSNIRWWLDAQAEAAGTMRNEEAPAPLLHLESPARAGQSAVVPILGEIAWNQDAPYNGLCPNESMTGCAATAMAMIMKHYNYPRIGRGNHSYTTPMGYNVSYDFEAKTFDWNNMLPTYTEGNYSEAQSNAVAELMKACGVSIEMDYTPVTSSANSLKVADALVKYFKYNDNLQFHIRSAYTGDEWRALLHEELEAARPVLYCGSSKQIGHEFVIDGCDENGLFHINWGWGGQANGYFDINSLNPLNPGIGGGTAEGGGYVYGQGMVTRLMPQKDQTADYSHNWYMNALVLINKLDNNGSMPRTEQLRIGAASIANYGPNFSGELAVVLAGEINDEPAAVIGNRGLSEIRPAYGGDLELGGYLPDDVADGTYYLYVAAKGSKSEKWEQVRAFQGYTSCLRVVIKDGSMKFYNVGSTPRLQGSMTVDSELKINSYGSFTVKVRNPGNTHYYGYVGVLITPTPQSQEYSMFYEEVYLDPGEERTVSLTKAIINSDRSYFQEGQSVICGIYTYGQNVYPLTDFKPVQIGFVKAPKLKLTQELQCQEVFKSNDEFFIPFSVDCEGDYKYGLVAGTFPWGTYQTNITVGTQLDMKEGDHLDSEIRGHIKPALAEGKYLVALLAYNMNTGKYDYELGHTSFEVKGYNGIDSAVADGEAEAIYFNMQGQRVDNPQKGDVLIRVDRNGSKKVKY